MSKAESAPVGQAFATIFAVSAKPDSMDSLKGTPISTSNPLPMKVKPYFS